jgi:hypothetical protein
MEDGVGLSGLGTVAADTTTPRHVTNTTAFMYVGPSTQLLGELA